jgi:hypothetical protein
MKDKQNSTIKALFRLQKRLERQHKAIHRRMILLDADIDAAIQTMKDAIHFETQWKGSLPEVPKKKLKKLKKAAIKDLKRQASQAA